MDEKKVFGVQQALGKGIAKHGKEALERLRKTRSRTEFLAFLQETPGVLPEKLLQEYLAIPTDEDWERHRAKVVVATKVALGQVQVVKAHDDPFAAAEKALQEGGDKPA
ncbi:MAG TPA: hypothetical protein VNZ52_09545 [Candidatus Thermoplasmatota archaeon]|nr:hypothetical protein [Candidatus Thermoplasmatota archaeon]